jgi:threonine/homoserine/homoserine lactone efflux protein
VDAALVTAFFAAAIPAFFTPGPNNLMLMTSSARFGLGRTVPHMLGVVLGFPLMVLLIGLGLGAVFEAVPVLKTILKFAAAAYLLWMAWMLLGLKLHATKAGDRPMRLHEAVLFQWVNPKAWVMAVSFVALVVGSGPGRPWNVALLTLGCLLLAPFSSALWMVGGQQLELWLRRSGVERYLGVVLAALMVIAVVLFLV